VLWEEIDKGTKLLTIKRKMYGKYKRNHPCAESELTWKNIHSQNRHNTTNNEADTLHEKDTALKSNFSFVYD
jgi:hypothetical protein